MIVFRHGSHAPAILRGEELGFYYVIAYVDIVTDTKAYLDLIKHEQQRKQLHPLNNPNPSPIEENRDVLQTDGAIAIDENLNEDYRNDEEDVKSRRVSGLSNVADRYYSLMACLLDRKLTDAHVRTMLTVVIFIDRVMIELRRSLRYRSVVNPRCYFAQQRFLLSS
jgi:hypothetical protein